MRKLNSLLASGMLVLGLTACVGDGDDEDTGTTIGTATQTTTATATATQGTDSTTDGTGGTSDGTGGGSGGTTTTAGTGGTTTTTDGTGGSTGGGAGEDPNYPKPDVGNMCPDGTAGPVTFNDPTDMTSVCAPECTGAGNNCPDAETGDAVAQCLFNPDSTGDTCTTDTDCTATGESCVQTGGGGMACLLPVSHCVLICSDGTNTVDCPDSMTCTPIGICEYG